jgi:hypothetical protein
MCELLVSTLKLLGHIISFHSPFNKLLGMLGLKLCEISLTSNENILNLLSQQLHFSC